MVLYKNSHYFLLLLCLNFYLSLSHIFFSFSKLILSLTAILLS